MLLLFHPAPTLTSNLSRSRKKEQEWELDLPPLPQLCCAVKSGFGRGGWQSHCSSHTWCYAQNEKEYEKEKEKDLKAGRYTNLSLSLSLSRNFVVPAMTIGINKRETLLYKLTDCLPNPDLTAQHSLQQRVRAGVGAGGRRAEGRRNANLSTIFLGTGGFSQLTKVLC